MTVTDDGIRLTTDQVGGESLAPWVTAVVVSHDGDRWLGRTVAAIAEQRRPADVVVVVDTGSTDGSLALAQAAPGVDRVVSAGRRTGFGDAVRLGLAELARPGQPSGPDREALPDDGAATLRPAAAEIAAGRGWIWLLHDDSAPAPDALDVLLDVASRSTQVGVVGPKLVEWDDPTQLVEVGLTVSRGGRRFSGVEDVERDQGQHDHRTDVLAVGTAGMLVRADVWAELGGLDPALPLLRDDIDLCWRAQLAGHRVVIAPRAVVADAQATVRGLRQADVVAGPVGRDDQARGLQVAMARCSLVALPGLILWTLVAGVVRGLGLLAAKEPRRSRDELLATGIALGTPWRWMGSRRRARGTRRVARRDIAGLFMPRTAGLRRVVDSWGALAARDQDASVLDNLGDTESGADGLNPVDRTSLTRRVLGHPLTTVLLVLAAATAVAWRSLATTVLSGALTGGQLGRLGGRPADLWHAAIDPWHGGGLGSGQASSPAAFVRVLGAVLLGPFGAAAAPRAAALLLLLAVPAAAVATYLALTGLVGSRWVRAWAALVWGSTPVLTAAVGEGRLGPVAAAVLAPLVAGAMVRAFSARRPGATTATFAGAFGVALIGSAVPALLVLAMLVSVAALVRGPGAVRVRALVLLVLPLGLIGPWLGALVSDPRLILGGPGAVQALPAGGGTTAHLLALPDLVRLPELLVRHGVPGWAAPACLAPVVLVGVLALLRGERRGRVVLAAWLFAILVLAGAFLVSGVVLARVADVEVRPWPGGLLLVVALVVVATAVVAADGVVQWLSRHRFGWRQALVGPLAVLVVAGPLIGLGMWAWRGTDGPLAHGVGGSVPAVADAAAQGPAAVRTLVLTVPPDENPSAPSGDDQALGYTVVGAEPGPWARDLPVGAVAQGGSTAATSLTTASQAVEEVVRAVVDGPGAVADGPGPATPADPVDLLGRLAVGFVMIEAAPGAAPPAGLVARLDGTAGLVRIGAPAGAVVWRVGLGGFGTSGSGQNQPARVRIETPAGQVLSTVASRAGHASVDTALGASTGQGQRLLVLSEPASARWHATLDGAELPVAAGHAGAWRQAFVLPSTGGRLVVGYHDPVQRWWQIGQAVLAGLVLLLALPTRRHPTRTVEELGGSTALDERTVVAAETNPADGPGPVDGSGEDSGPGVDLRDGAIVPAVDGTADANDLGDLGDVSDVTVR